MVKSTKVELQGKVITLETGMFGAQANAAVTARCGDTLVLATVVSSDPVEGLDYFPLQVEYQERYYAGGMITSNRFIKREGRPSENEILTGRVIDRSIRPLFPDHYRDSVQVIVNPLSIDGVNEPEILGVLATSAAIAISNIPWNGPIGSLRIGMDKDGGLIANPTNEEKTNSKLDLVVSGPANQLSMVEAGANEVTEEEMSAALKFGQDNVTSIAKQIADFAKEVGKTKREVAEYKVDSELVKLVKEELGDLDKILSSEATDPGARMLSTSVKAICERHEDQDKNLINEIAHDLIRDLARKGILDNGIRPDGRKIEDIRPISCEVGLIPRVHGSGFFQRGLTHVLSVVTLASPSRVQLTEGMKGEQTKRYMHHYNMPPYASGETGRVGSPGRREIGHGALAERAILPMLPSEKDFPYTIRVVSEIMSSNGSTSQGSVCGSTLSLMDAGVPLKKPVSGVAMGLITGDNKAVTLTDISGLEDHLGDMDFKVAGTADGITALQMDIKLDGIPVDILINALDQAKRGRLFILDKMTSIIDKPRESISVYAPKIATLSINKEKIGELIGPGGKNIRSIQETYGVEVNIEEDGSVSVVGSDAAKVDSAKNYISGIMAEAEIGKTYMGTVARKEAFGVFVNILPGKDGLVHVSNLAGKLDSLNEGDQLEVKVYEIDNMGRVNLCLAGSEPVVMERQSRPESRGGFRDNRGGRSEFRRFRDHR